MLNINVPYHGIKLILALDLEVDVSNNEAKYVVSTKLPLSILPHAEVYKLVNSGYNLENAIEGLIIQINRELDNLKTSK